MSGVEIKPCLVCQSLERKPGEGWKHACPKHVAVLHICCTSVEDGIHAAKSANLEELETAFNYELKRKGSRKSLRVAIAREIKKRIAAQTVKKLLPILVALLLVGCQPKATTHVQTSTIHAHVEYCDCVSAVNSWWNSNAVGGQVFGVSYAITNLPPRWVFESVKVTNADKEIDYATAQSWVWKPFANYSITTNSGRAEIILSVLIDTNIPGRVFRVRKLK